MVASYQRSSAESTSHTPISSRFTRSRALVWTCAGFEIKARHRTCNRRSRLRDFFPGHFHPGARAIRPCAPWLHLAPSSSHIASRVPALAKIDGRAGVEAFQIPPRGDQRFQCTDFPVSFRLLNGDLGEPLPRGCQFVEHVRAQEHWRCEAGVVSQPRLQNLRGSRVETRQIYEVNLRRLTRYEQTAGVRRIDRRAIVPWLDHARHLVHRKRSPQITAHNGQGTDFHESRLSSQEKTQLRTATQGRGEDTLQRGIRFDSVVGGAALARRDARANPQSGGSVRPCRRVAPAAGKHLREGKQLSDERIRATRRAGVAQSRSSIDQRFKHRIGGIVDTKIRDTRAGKSLLEA